MEPFPTLISKVTKRGAITWKCEKKLDLKVTKSDLKVTKSDLKHENVKKIKKLDLNPKNYILNCF